jgi:hypothetical protein
MTAPSTEQPARGGWRDEWLPAAVSVVTVGAVLAIGGVHPATQVLLASLIVLLVGAFILLRGKRGVRAVPFAGVMALAVGVTALQLVPLPAPLVGFLSPRAHEARLMATPDARFMPLTVDAPATWLALARGIACLGLIILTDGLIRTRQQGRRFLGLLAATGAGLAIVAFAQRLVGAKQILGVYTPRGQPGFGFFGTFVDVNHCASVLALATLVAAGLAVERRGRERALLVAAAVIAGGALLFTGSRGALVGFAVGGMVLTLILAARVMGLLRAAVMALVILLIGASLSLWANEGLRARTLGPSSQLWSNQKVRGWSDAIRMANAYRWTGVGRGAFETPINAFRTNDEAVRLVYPEDLVVQLVSEWGFVAALALLGMAFIRAVKLAPAVARLHAGVIAAGCGVLAVVTHELVDFGLEMPGVAFPTVMALGVVTGGVAVEQRRTTRTRSWRLSPKVALGLVGAAALVMLPATWSAGHTLDDDWERMRKGDDAGALEAAMARHPTDDYLALLAAQRAMRDGRPEMMNVAMRQLNRALTLHPYNWQAHRMTARLLVALQRPAQAALEYRLARETGMPLDITEMVRVLGPHVVDAAPQTRTGLVELARGLYMNAHPVEADAAAARAVDLSDEREPLLVERARLAVEFQKPAQLVSAGRALLAEAEAPDSFVLAARALAAGGERFAANGAIDAGLKRHPRDGLIFLTGARLRFEVSDFAGARQLLARAGKEASLSLEDRLHAEELLADVADRTGDTSTAVLARARSRMIAQRIRDMSFSHDKP